MRPAQCFHTLVTGNERRACNEDETALPLRLLNKGIEVTMPSSRRAWRMPAACPTEEDRPLVADECTAAVGQDRGALGETCPLLLALAGRGVSDAAPVRGNGAADRGAARARGITWAMAAGISVETEVRERSSFCGAEGKGGSSRFGQHGRGSTSPLGRDRGHAGGTMSLAWLEGRHGGISSHDARRSTWKSRLSDNMMHEEALRR